MSQVTVDSKPAATLPKKVRIARRGDFLRTYEIGRKQFARFSVVFVSPGEHDCSRIGITATRKVGKSHDRNRLKRWVRETFRMHRHALQADAAILDFVVNLRSNALKVTFAEFSGDLLAALRKASRQGSLKERGTP